MFFVSLHVSPGCAKRCYGGRFVELGLGGRFPTFLMSFND